MVSYFGTSTRSLTDDYDNYCVFSFCCSSPQTGLAVKERKWGRAGYNKTTTHTYTETTPTHEAEGVDSTDTGDTERELAPIVAVSYNLMYQLFCMNYKYYV